ncbi:hypothetical protein SDD30_14130 [Moorella naiadis]|uniref:hypothetical protein n=1 Tax=Moorella naiadis (nom. illeg.) TaxID=3093670 RepID=UPI003D9CA8AE
MDNITKVAKNILFGIKDPAILIGTLYVISFLLLWPFLQNFHFGPLNEYKLLLVSVIGIVLVHLFLNWVYVLTVAIPMTMVVILFVAGAAIWIFAPTYTGFIVGAFSVWDFFMAGLSSLPSNIVSGLGESVSRIGQFMMMLAGGLWWLVQKAKSIEQNALVVYLIGLGSFGFLSSLVSTEALFAFLFFWMIVNAKVQGKEAPNIANIFRILSTIAVVFKVPFLPVHYQGMAAGILWLYKAGLTGTMLMGIWKPEKLLEFLPEQFKQYGTVLVNTGKRAIKI